MLSERMKLLALGYWVSEDASKLLMSIGSEDGFCLGRYRRFIYLYAVMKCSWIGLFSIAYFEKTSVVAIKCHMPMILMSMVSLCLWSDFSLLYIVNCDRCCVHIIEQESTVRISPSLVLDILIHDSFAYLNHGISI